MIVTQWISIVVIGLIAVTGMFFLVCDTYLSNQRDARQQADTEPVEGEQ